MKAGNQDVLKSVFLPGMLLLCSLTGLLMEAITLRIGLCNGDISPVVAFQCGCPQRCPKCGYNEGVERSALPE